jgi:hypothetical protein
VRLDYNTHYQEPHIYTDKKVNEIFLIYKEIQMGSGARSYMRKGFLIYEEMGKYLNIYEEAVSHVTLHPNSSEFPYIRGKFNLFLISVYQQHLLDPIGCFQTNSLLIMLAQYRAVTEGQKWDGSNAQFSDKIEVYSAIT